MCRRYSTDIYVYLPARVSYTSWSSHPSVFSPLSARVDVRRCRRGLRARPYTPLDSGMRYILREKTSSIDNLLEELARVHANFWIIMPRRVHYASYRHPLRRLSPTASFHPVLRRFSTRCCSYLLRPPILANCTLQLISDTVRATEYGEGAGGPANFELEVGGLRRYPVKSISKENIISRGKRPLNSAVNKWFNL